MQHNQLHLFARPGSRVNDPSRTSTWRYAAHRCPKRQAARAAGAVRYMDGVPCSHGHVAERYTFSGRCVVCNADKERRNGRKRRGLPEATRPKPPTCESCGQPPQAKGLALDHDHETGAFRGWLCGPCNTAIGALGDSEVGLQRAMDYLRRSKQ